MRRRLAPDATLVYGHLRQHETRQGPEVLDGGADTAVAPFWIGVSHTDKNVVNARMTAAWVLNGRPHAWLCPPPIVRTFAREQLVQHDPERVHVGLRSCDTRLKRFWSGVFRRSEPAPSAYLRSVRWQVADAEVTEANHVVKADEDVLRLDDKRRVCREVRVQKGEQVRMAEATLNGSLVTKAGDVFGLPYLAEHLDGNRSLRQSEPFSALTSHRKTSAKPPAPRRATM